MDTAQHVIETSRQLFTTEDLMIIVLVAACVVLMPLFVLGFRKRSEVRAVSLIVLAAYAAGELYFTFFNRTHPIQYDYNVISPLTDISAAFHVDFGIVGFFRELFHGNVEAAFSAIHIGNMRKAREVLLNVLLYLPLGYLLPFVSKRLRRPSLILLIGFLCSLATELGQYYTKLGYFQIDDLVCNTMGALIGGIIGILLCALWRVE